MDPNNSVIVSTAESKPTLPCYVGNSTRVFLMHTVTGDHDYINAVYVPVSYSLPHFVYLFLHVGTLLSNYLYYYKYAPVIIFCHVMIQEILIT